MRKKRLLWLFVVIVFMAVLVASSTVFAQYGLTKDEIKTIQKKLKNWGYYTGEIDGVYGSKTTAAVKYFQRTNGLTQDGIVGSRTAEKLGMTLGGSSSSSGKKDTDPDVYLLARVVYGEARGEPYKGQVAVGAVVLNRVDHPEFPNTLSGVIYQKGAFDAVSDGQINLTPDATALKAARDAINGVDPSSGCLFYYNPEKSTNKWMLSKQVFLVIGKHSFCK